MEENELQLGLLIGLIRAGMVGTLMTTATLVLLGVGLWTHHLPTLLVSGVILLLCGVSWVGIGVFGRSIVTGLFEEWVWAYVDRGHVRLAPSLEDVPQRHRSRARRLKLHRWTHGRPHTRH